MSTALTVDCDRAIAHATPCADTSGAADAAGAATPHPTLVLATTILASSLAFIDGSVVNVGLPAIGRDLGAGGAGLAWIVNGYLLPLSALLLLGGAAGDRYGRRRLLLLGVSLFALASLLCACAPTAALLVAGRVLQGIGAALLMPNSLAILGASFSGEARGRAIGIWAAVGAGAGALGPVLGGWLIDVLGWRSIFLINLPVALLALVLGARCLRDDVDPNRPALDWLGAALASAGLACLTWGLTVASGAGNESQAQQTGWAAGLAAGIGVIFLLLFLVREHRAGACAMLPLQLFSSSSFSALNMLTFLLYGALGALMVLLPFVLIEVAHYSATRAGAALLPLPLVIALASSSMGRIAARIGSRLPLTLGPLIVAAGFALSMRISESGSYWSTTLPAMLVIAIGMAGAVAPLTNAVLASVDAQRTGLASGFNSAVARTGGLIATALLGLIFGAHGAQLVHAFHAAALVAAGAALAAAACAFFWLGPTPAPASNPD